MVWTWDAILVLGIAQVAFSAPSFEDRSSAALVRREAIIPSEVNDELRRSSSPFNGKTSHSFNRIEMVKSNQEDESPKAVLSSPILYHLREEMSPSDPSALRFAEKASALRGEPFLRESWRSGGDDLFSFDHLQEEDSAVENGSDEDTNLVSSSSHTLNAEQGEKGPHGSFEPIWLRKRRLQMKGPGLFGNSFNRNILGQKSLAGYRGTKNKGLVLSIDLGIKALRDAILHAKVQQKNRKLQAQAQKNMRLLHNIGKRTASSESIFISP